MMEFKVLFPDQSERVFYPAIVRVNQGIIEKIIPVAETNAEGWLTMLPGFVDAHVHIESSMLVPSGFAEIAVRHGTIATVSDPHEIANVLGKTGVIFMRENAVKVPLKIHFTVPSCVPATDFEQSGAELNADDIGELLDLPGIAGLGEMMNFPGVIYQNNDVLEKIRQAHIRKMVVDGHAPGLRGNDLRTYINAGINTDHEAYSYEEAREKIELGMKILIREGSAAKNFEALHQLISEFPDQVMLCADDLHPDDLIVGHINLIVKRALEKGHDLFDIIKTSSINPVKHYNLPVGLLCEGDPADFILVDNRDNLNVVSTWIDGLPVYESGISKIGWQETELPNSFIDEKLKADDFVIEGTAGVHRVIGAIDGSLITDELLRYLAEENGLLLANPENDILKITVVNRYQKAKPSVGFIAAFGLKKGAIASSVAHDSHNIIAVGCSDEAITSVVNALIDSKGGIAVFDGNHVSVLPLPVAGIMSNAPAGVVAGKYSELNNIAASLGCTLKAPFMTLSFMALLVIPSLKIGDRGLFDVNKFDFVSLRKDK